MAAYVMAFWMLAVTALYAIPFLNDLAYSLGRPLLGPIKPAPKKKEEKNKTE